MKKHMVTLLVLALVLSMFQIPNQAKAATVKLNKSSIKVIVGKSVTLKVKGTKKKAKWTVKKGKKLIQLRAKKSSSVKVKGIKKGTAKVQCRVGKKNLYCRVQIKGKKNEKQELPTSTKIPTTVSPTPVPTCTSTAKASATPSTFPNKSSDPEYQLKVYQTPGPVANYDCIKIETYLHRVKLGDNDYYKREPDQYSHFLESNVLRRDIETIIFCKTNVVPNDTIGSFDVSEKNNGSVMAWYTDTDQDGRYEMTIGQKGGVVANEDSSYLLSDINNKSKEDQGGEPFVQGIENLDTSHVKDMSYMFKNSGDYTHKFDVGDSFDTSNVTDTSSMFENCVNITEFSFGKKMTFANVDSEYAMFDNSDTQLLTDRLCYVQDQKTKDWMVQHAMNLCWVKSTYDDSSDEYVYYNDIDKLGNIIVNWPKQSFRPTHKATSSCLMVEPITKYNISDLKETSTSYKLDYQKEGIYFFGSTIPRSNIKNLHIADTNKVPDGVLGSIDVSKAQDGSVVAWYTKSDDTGLYDVTIGQEGGVIANEDSSYLFSDIICVDGLENLYTSGVKNMSYMFYRYGECYFGRNDMLDLGLNFDTTNVTNVTGMFREMGLGYMCSIYLRDGFTLKNVKESKNMIMGLYGNVYTSNNNTYEKIQDMETKYDQYYELKHLTLIK